MNKVFLTEEMFGVKLVCKSSHQILFRTQKEAAGDSQLVCERRGGSTGPSLGPPWCPCPRCCCCWPPARSSPPSPSPSCARARPSSWRRRAARPSWSAGSPTSPPTTWWGGNIYIKTLNDKHIVLCRWAGWGPAARWRLWAWGSSCSAQTPGYTCPVWPGAWRKRKHVSCLAVSNHSFPLFCLLPISKYVMLILCVALLWLLLLPLYWIWKGRKVGGQTSDSIWRIKLFSTSYNIFLNKSATHFLLLIFLDIFSCRRWQDVNVWILRIENVSRADAGIYQCQVTSYLHFHHSSSREAGRHNCPKLPYLYSLPAVNVAHHKKSFLH